MAILNLLLDPTKQTRKVTPEAEQHARLIGALLCCAKTLQRATVSADNTCEASAFRKLVEAELSDLFVSLVGLYGNEGKRMEVEALALADRLGFRIEQRDITLSQPRARGGVH